MKPNTFVTFTASLTLLKGLLFLGFAAGIALHRAAFLADAVATEGTVIGFREKAVVRFTGSAGTMEFRATNLSDYQLGQSVPVLYRPSDPQDASVNSFWDLWLPPAFFAAIATPFTLFGTRSFACQVRRRAIKRTLLSSGAPILTDFQRVCVDTSLNLNGQSPFVVYTQWQNPRHSRSRPSRARGSGMILRMISSQSRRSPCLSTSRSRSTITLISPSCRSRMGDGRLMQDRSAIPWHKARSGLSQH